MENFFFKYQLILFSNYGEVIASPDIITFFASKFIPLGLIPRQSQEVSFKIYPNDPENVEQGMINRIALNSTDRKWEITFHKDTLSFIYSFDLSEESSFSIIDFKIKVLEYLSIIEEKFDRKFYRLGILVDKFNHIDDKDKNDAFLKFNAKSNLLESDSTPIEWTNKIVLRDKIKNLGNEPVNIVNENSYLVAKLNSNNKEILFTGIRNIIELNTLAFIVDKKFDKANLEVFVDESILLINKVLEDNKL